jgi:hypothetical protein
MCNVDWLSNRFLSGIKPDTEAKEMSGAPNNAFPEVLMRKSEIDEVN